LPDEDIDKMVKDGKRVINILLKMQFDFIEMFTINSQFISYFYRFQKKY